MADVPVVNASPLLVLARAGALDLLQLAGSSIAVPDAVAREIAVHPTADAAVRALDTIPWLVRVPEIAIPPVIVAWDLGLGESAVLAWAFTHQSTAILDDLAARRCSETIGVAVRGTLGLALLAKKRGVVNAARPLVTTLRRCGLYLSDKVIDKALAQVGE